MIVKSITFVCDAPTCTARHKTTRGEGIKHAEVILKSLGWKTVVHSRQRYHYCPDCAKLLNEE